MKQLDWKSFAIGVLLTTTLMFGSGAATSTTEKWDANQKWGVLRTGFEKKTTREAGYDPFTHWVITLFGAGASSSH